MGTTNEAAPETTDTDDQPEEAADQGRGVPEPSDIGSPLAPAPNGPSTPVPWKDRLWWVPWVGTFVAVLQLPFSVCGNLAQQRATAIAQSQVEKAERRDADERAEVERRRSDRADAGPQLTARLIRLAPKNVRMPDGGAGLQFVVGLELSNHSGFAEIVSGASLAFGTPDSGPQHYFYANGLRFGLNQAVAPNSPTLVEFGCEAIDRSTWLDTLKLGRPLGGNGHVALKAWLFVRATRGTGCLDLSEMDIDRGGTVMGHVAVSLDDFTIVPTSLGGMRPPPAYASSTSGDRPH